MPGGRIWSSSNTTFSGNGERKNPQRPGSHGVLYFGMKKKGHVGGNTGTADAQEGALMHVRGEWEYRGLLSKGDLELGQEKDREAWRERVFQGALRGPEPGINSNIYSEMVLHRTREELTLRKGLVSYI